MTPALLCVGNLWRDRRVRPWLFVSVLLILDHATYHAWYPQQSAASTVLIALMLVQCWRRLRIWQRGRGYGIAIARNLIVGFAVSIAAVSIGRATENRLPMQFHKIWASLFPAPSHREEAVSYLRSIPGKHLVFVEYSADHPYTDEWVFNGSDIATERVTFARVCGPTSDHALIRALPDHDVWLVRPDLNSLERIDPESVDSNHF